MKKTTTKKRVIAHQVGQGIRMSDPKPASSSILRLPRQPVRCLGGCFPMDQDFNYCFSVIQNEEHGIFAWVGKTMPDQFKQADGHVYECIWCDERVEFRLVEENTRLTLLPVPIIPMDEYVMMQFEERFYTIRNKLRELGKEVSRTDFETLILQKVPFATLGAPFSKKLV